MPKQHELEDQPELTLSITLKGDMAHRFQSLATERKMSFEQLAEEFLHRGISMAELDAISRIMFSQPDESASATANRVLGENKGIHSHKKQP